MKSTLWQRTLCSAGLALAVVVPAQAATLTFEGATPGSIYMPPAAYAERSFTFATTAGLGVIDTSAAFGLGVGLDLAGPKGNATQFYIGLNDAVLRMAGDGTPFRLAGFSFGFVSALTQLFVPGELAGKLVANYETGGGILGTMSWDFGAADALGEFSFRMLGLSDMGEMSSGVRQVSFFACTYDQSLACLNPNANFSQFAVDNFRIPEPSSMAMALLALGIVGGLRARRSH